MTDTAIRNVKPGEKACKLFDAGGVYFSRETERRSSVAGAIGYGRQAGQRRLF
jgi:hypothetical protein